MSMSFLLIEIGLAHAKCYRWVKESKENVENFMGMLHHIYDCIRVKRNTSKQSQSLLLATTSFKQQNDEETDKLAYSHDVGLNSA